MKLLITGILLCCFFNAGAQIIMNAIIRSSEGPLPGAIISWKEINAHFLADSSGTVTIYNIKPGEQHFQISHVGYKEKTVSYTFPLRGDSLLVIVLEKEENEEEEVIVMATRSSRTIANTPTRIEVISGEELDEKANMKPGDIRMLLSETTGIQTQQTSATSFNSSIRIQGLDGRYTQILKDGFPLYAGFSGGLSIMQVAPLDLAQVEVIKGSSSTLYGGGAIAGLVNLVSKVPRAKKELNFLANATSAGGLDLSGFYSERFAKTGITVFASRNSNAPYDPAGNGLTAIPQFQRYSLHPRFFIYGKKINTDFGFTWITEKRTGGSMDYIRKDIPGYFEKNNTDRLIGQAAMRYIINESSSFTAKASYGLHKRTILIPSYWFSGLQQSFFSELAYLKKREKTQWIAGINLLADDFREDAKDNRPLRDYHYFTAGLFTQYTWSPNNIFSLESGLRGESVSRYGFEWLPRLSLLFKFTPSFTLRAGGGMGYKTPTVFNEDAERIQFQNIRGINTAITHNERSTGFNIDFNYRVSLGTVKLSINQLFFYTKLRDPLVLAARSGGQLEFENATGHIDTRGMETNLKFIRAPFKLFVGYTYADVNTHFNHVLSWLPLTSRHRLNNVLFYENEKQLKFGLEAYYFSPQRLNDGSRSRSYWVFGLMAEKGWRSFSLFINFENFTDTRQTKFGSIYTGSISDPVFKDIYAPLDGFVVNGGIKLRLFPG